MRRHENIGYDAFNSYRSGDENSSRNKYGTSPGNERGGSSVYGRSSRDTDASDHNYSTDPGYYGTGSGNMNQPNQRQNYDEHNRYAQNRSQNPGGNMQNRGNQFGNRDAYNSGPGNFRNDNRNQHNNWADRAEERIDQWGNKINAAWDRWSGDENNQVRQNWVNQPHNYSTYSHGNASGNRYSDNYGNSPSNYNENRGYNQGNRHEDEGFFDHLGNKISNAWDRWVGNDEDEERRYQNRSQYPPSGNASRRNDDNRNSPGSYNRREDEW
jgi:hypothetical protein